jgi:amino acid permease
MKILKSLAMIVLFIIWIILVIGAMGGGSDRAMSYWEKREHVTSTPG